MAQHALIVGGLDGVWLRPDGNALQSGCGLLCFEVKGVYTSACSASVQAVECPLAFGATTSVAGNQPGLTSHVVRTHVQLPFGGLRRHD